MKNKIQFLTMNGCSTCEVVEATFNEIMPDFADKIELKKIDITSDEGQKLVQKYGIMGSPGIIINDELFSIGGVNEQKLIEKLKSLK